MFGTKKKKVKWNDHKLFIPPPRKKEFKTMFEILRDAEKYDNANEIEVRNNTLQNLVDYINDFRLKNIS